MRKSPTLAENETTNTIQIAFIAENLVVVKEVIKQSVKLFAANKEAGPRTFKFVVRCPVNQIDSLIRTVDRFIEEINQVSLFNRIVFRERDNEIANILYYIEVK